MLNREGIELLKSDLRADAIHYDQRSFGSVTAPCGTVACIAGMCLRRAIGHDQFTARIRQLTETTGNGWGDFVADCLAAAIEQIGITVLPRRQYDRIAVDSHLESGGLPPIFCAPYYWPPDLRKRYNMAAKIHDHAATVEVACAALDRMNEYGVLSLLPDAL